MDDQFADRHAVVLGGAGFLGSHLTRRLVEAGTQVTVIDNFITGRADNVGDLVGRPGFRLVHYDVTDFLHVPGTVDFVLHFASPASPVDYLHWPIQTLKVGSLGTHKALGLALDKGARFLLASTSEVYGDPLVSPQPESYWGNVNPVGPRGVYDEAKRFAEALTLAYHREHGVDARIVRIFNSVLADEQVLYDDGKELRRERVETAARRLGVHVEHATPQAVELTGCTVPSFDAAGEVRATPASALVAHPTTQRCFEVRTRYGRSIRVTGDHSLFSEGPDGRPAAKPVNELLVGDRVAIQGRVRVAERDRSAVRLVDVWGGLGLDPWDLQVSAPRWRDEGELPLAAIQRLGIDLPGDPEATVRKARSKVRIASTIRITDDLLWLLGLYVAGGCRHEAADGAKAASVTITAEEELLQRARKVVERDLGLHVVESEPTHERPSAITVHSQLLLLVLDHLGLSAGPKRVPGWVLGLPLSRLQWFIEGYREGDGVHAGQALEQAKRHAFTAVSDELKDDLVVALARFGLVASVGRDETFWRVAVSDVSPWSPLDWDGGVEQRLQSRRCGDLVWAAVEEIIEIEPTTLVYDFSVPGQENFWAGTGIAAKNTYGPRMRIDDGRAIPAFFAAALRNEPLPVFGDGSQTRSLCYVDDEIEGILRLLASDHVGPVNIGNPEEVTILELAEAVQDAVGSHPGVVHQPAPEDDPKVRRPDTTLAERVLGWKARVPLDEGLARTADWFRKALDDST